MSELDVLVDWENIKKKVVHKRIGEYLYDMMQKEPDMMKRYVPKTEWKKFRQYTQERGSNRYKYCMITINPREGIDVDHFVKKVCKAVKKTWVRCYGWCIEWRKYLPPSPFNDGGGIGMHAHVVIEFKKGKNPYRAKGEFYNTFKHLVGNRKHVDIKYSNRDGAFLDYVQGLKGGKPKENAKWDNHLRGLHEIPTVEWGIN